MNRTVLPKNVRQIGKSDSEKKIYIEDYVVTFIKQSAMSKSKGNIILLGETGNVCNTQATFINGAITLKEEEVLVNEIISKEAWDDVYYRLQNYFEGYNIIGWCCISQDSVNDDNYGFMLQKFTNIQRKNFPGNDKVFIHYNSVMMEENVYFAKDNILKVPRGYYVYYERNDKMQEYMMCESERIGTDHEYEDEITTKIRDAINEKDNIKTGIGNKVRHGIISKGDRGRKKWLQNGYTAVAAIAVVCLLAVAAGKNKIDIRHVMNVVNEKIHQGNADGTSGKKESAEVAPINESLRDNVSQTMNEEKEELVVEDVPGDIPDNKGDKKDNKKDNKNKDKGDDKKNEENNENAKEQVTQGRDYKIKEGDTLAQISKDNYGTVLKVDQICKLNGIENENMIHQGDVIKLPD